MYMLTQEDMHNHSFHYMDIVGVKRIFTSSMSSPESSSSSRYESGSATADFSLLSIKPRIWIRVTNRYIHHHLCNQLLRTKDTSIEKEPFEQLAYKKSGLSSRYSLYGVMEFTLRLTGRLCWSPGGELRSYVLPATTIEFSGIWTHDTLCPNRVF